jgi:hypothetical protein
LAKPNYAYEKRQRELEKKRKKEEKARKKTAGDGAGDPSEATDAPPAPQNNEAGAPAEPPAAG